MDFLRPDISDELTVVADVAKVLQQDETLLDLLLENGDAPGLKLKSAVLQGCKFVKCNLAHSKIDRLQLRDCLLNNCDLTAGVFADSSWHAVEVSKTRCSGIQLQKGLLKNVWFKNSKLDVANFRFAKLEQVVFESCVITEADFYSATLKNVRFIDCDFEDVEFSEATLQHVDLTESRILSVKGLRGLKGATINQEQLVQLAPSMAQEIGIIIQD